MKIFVGSLVALLACINCALGATTITLATNNKCGANDATTLADNTVEVTCDMTATLTDVIADAGAVITFKLDGVEVFSLAEAGANAAAVAMSGSGSTILSGATLTGSDVSDNLKVSIASYPTTLAAQGLYTCEITDTDTGTNDGAEAAGAYAATADLAYYCANGNAALPAAGLTITETGACATNVIMTCDTALSLDSILADSTVRVVFLKGTTEAFELAAATTALASGIAILDSTNFPNTVTFAAVAENGNLKVTITNFPVAQDGSDWTCKAVDSTTTAVTGSTLRNDVSGTASSETALACRASISIEPCTKTMSCAFPIEVATLQTDSGIIYFKKAGTTQFQIATDDAVTSDGSTSVTGVTATAPLAASVTGRKIARLTFGATATFDSTLDGDWTCEVDASTASNDFVSPSTTLSTACVAAISIDACARTMSCTFPTNVDTLQTDNGIIYFKKAGTTQFQIAHANDAVTDGSTSVTGVTATAPVGASTTNAKIARLTFAATATFDSTLDGAWTCEVDADTATNDIVSPSTTLSATCGSAMNKVVGLLVVLMMTIKVLVL